MLAALGLGSLHQLGSWEEPQPPQVLCVQVPSTCKVLARSICSKTLGILPLLPYQTGRPIRGGGTGFPLPHPTSPGQSRPPANQAPEGCPWHKTSGPGVGGVPGLQS